MGFFDALFGSEKPKANTKTARAEVVEVVEQDDNVISPEIIAVISAAVYAALDTGDRRIGYRINSISNAWAATVRQKIMDAREFAQ